MNRTALISAAIAVAACGGARPAGAPSCRGLEVTGPGQLEALSGCETITGDLAIRGAAITDLDSLSSLQAIRGSLIIGPTSRLVSTRGLARLGRIDGDLEISRNFELGGVYLGSLASLGGDLRVERNLSLITASLHRLVDVGGDVAIAGNRALERIDLSALARVGGDLEIRGTDELVAVLPESVDVRGRRHIAPVHSRESR